MNPEVKRLAAENSSLRAKVRSRDAMITHLKQQLEDRERYLEELFCPICGELAEKPVHDEECFK